MIKPYEIQLIVTSLIPGRHSILRELKSNASNERNYSAFKKQKFKRKRNKQRS